MSKLNVLFIGDIVGKLGRFGVQKLVPELRQKHNVDLVIANIENLAHGQGITAGTFAEIKDIGIDAFTSGNHIWTHKEGVVLLDNEETKILRPANYPPKVPGRGWLILEVKGQRVLLINLIGRVFMKKHFDDPFRAFDTIIEEAGDVNAVIVDFHAEASSEKKAFGYYIADRASLMVGTHTHIPTADHQLLSDSQLGYVTDVGMVGADDSIIGVDKQEIVKEFLTQLPVKHKMVEKGKIVFNSVLTEIDQFKSLKIMRIDLTIEGR